MKHYWLTLTYLEDEDEDDDETNLKPMMIWTSIAVIITYAYLKPVTMNYFFHEYLSSTKVHEGHMICTLEIVILLLFLNQKVNNKWFSNSDYK